MTETQALRARPLNHLRSASHNLLPQALSSAKMTSPAGRSRAATDDLINLLGPATALAALQAPPPGPLKMCLATAALSEKEFALRTATASARVLEWLNEMKDWPWPSGPDSSGFEEPGRGRGRSWTKGDQPPTDGEAYWGSLRSSDVKQLERRVDEISGEMELLGLEEIKEQVLHNHILPMSRPATPLSPGSLLTYNLMDDLTAVVTAIVVQALPNIAHLSRLLRVWAIRIAVLHGIPALLEALTDAELALRMGWNAISTGAHTTDNALSQKKFDTMRQILEAKISKPGGHLDRMLDSLEGLEDTLPEVWLDRMEAVEKDFGDWVAAGGRIIREAEWAKTAKQAPSLAPSPQFPSSDVLGSVPKLLIPSDDGNDGDDDGKGMLLPPIHMGATLRRASNESALSADISEGSADIRSRICGGRDSFSDARYSPPLRLSNGDVVSPSLAPTFADDVFTPTTPLDSSFDQIDEEDENRAMSSPDEQAVPVKPAKRDPADDYLRQRIRRILTNMPSNQFSLSSAEPTSATTLNLPDLSLPRVRKTGSREPLRGKRSTSSLSSSSRAQTPAYTLTPAPYAKGASQRRPNRGQQETRVYHLTRANGGPPIKLFIRVVGENGERVMVRVGGGWADLGEYLKEYAAHHGRRSTSTAADRVEIRDLATERGRNGSSPPRPSSAMDSRTPMTPLVVRKKRRGSHLDDIVSPISMPGSPPPETPYSAKPFSPIPGSAPRTPGRSQDAYATPSSRSRSRASSRSWGDADEASSSAPPVPPIPSIALGLAGPKGKEFEISEESKAWIESVQQKVRSDRRAVSSGVSSTVGSATAASPAGLARAEEFGDMGRVGGTKRVFRKALLDDGRK